VVTQDCSPPNKEPTRWVAQQHAFAVECGLEERYKEEKICVARYLWENVQLNKIFMTAWGGNGR
jgi:hypothetical protein